MLKCSLVPEKLAHPYDIHALELIKLITTESKELKAENIIEKIHFEMTFGFIYGQVLAR